MKKIVIVNNNLKVGGVQKSLINLLWAIYKDYDITLLLFDKNGEYVDQVPNGIKIIECSSLYKLLGISQAESRTLFESITRGILALICKTFGRPFVLKIINLSQSKIKEEYDFAISYLQNGDIKHFYGGVNEFVLHKIEAHQKIAFLHCDYANCGANHPKNNKLYSQFDCVAACSDGCKKSFIKTIPELSTHCKTVKNFHRHEVIKKMALQDSVLYPSDNLNIVIVGRLAHEKAIDRAIVAIHYVRKQSFPIMLHIIGSGSEEASLKKLMNEYDANDYIHFYGEQSNPYRFMKNADMLLLTSYHEAAPMVIDEARIVGIPTLTVRTTSSEEMIIPYENGWICDNDQESLNSFLLELATNPGIIKKMKEQLIKKEFDNTIAYMQLREVIKD